MLVHTRLQLSSSIKQINCIGRHQLFRWHLSCLSQSYTSSILVCRISSKCMSDQLVCNWNIDNMNNKQFIYASVGFECLGLSISDRGQTRKACRTLERYQKCIFFTKIGRYRCCWVSSTQKSVLRFWDDLKHISFNFSGL